MNFLTSSTTHPRLKNARDTVHSLKIAVFILLIACGTLIFLASPVPLWAAANGSLSGTLRDTSGAVVNDATITLVNVALKTEYRTAPNGEGFYSFPTLPVGHYDLDIEATGFRTERETNLSVDTDAALKFDAVLAVATVGDR